MTAIRPCDGASWTSERSLYGDSVRLIRVGSSASIQISASTMSSHQGRITPWIAREHGPRTGLEEFSSTKMFCAGVALRRAAGAAVRKPPCPPVPDRAGRDLERDDGERRDNAEDVPYTPHTPDANESPTVPDTEPRTLCRDDSCLGGHRIRQPASGERVPLLRRSSSTRARRDLRTGPPPSTTFASSRRESPEHESGGALCGAG